MKYDTAPTAPLEFANWIEMVAKDHDNAIAKDIRQRAYDYAGDTSNAIHEWMSMDQSWLYHYANLIRSRVPEIIAERLTQ